MRPLGWPSAQESTAGPREAEQGAFLICELCHCFQYTDDMENDVDSVLQEFEGGKASPSCRPSASTEGLVCLEAHSPASYPSEASVLSFLLYYLSVPPRFYFQVFCRLKAVTNQLYEWNEIHKAAGSRTIRWFLSHFYSLCFVLQSFSSLCNKKNKQIK